MLKPIKSCQIFIISFASLVMPSMGMGNTEMIAPNPGICCSLAKEEMIGQSAERRKRPHRKICEDFKLSDFAGKWVVNIASIGGISGTTTSGTSFVSVGQAQINRDGKGQFNVISGSTYNGVPGKFDTFAFGPGIVAITLQLTDPKNGAGAFSVVGGGVNDVVNFIATRSTETGKVTRLEGFRFSSLTSVSNQVSYVLTKQNED